jgi:hypothetical protein
MTYFSQARRTCGTTHFIRLCTILHATGFGLPPNFEDCYSIIWHNCSKNIDNKTEFTKLLRDINNGIYSSYQKSDLGLITLKCNWLNYNTFQFSWLNYNTITSIKLQLLLKCNRLHYWLHLMPWQPMYI